MVILNENSILKFFAYRDGRRKTEDGSNLKFIFNIF